MDIVLPRSVSAEAWLGTVVGFPGYLAIIADCGHNLRLVLQLPPSLYRLKPVLGLAQVGFHTVSARRNGRRHRLTKSVFTPTYARFRELLIEARENSKLTQSALA